MTIEPDASVLLATDRLVLRRFADTEDEARLLFELDRDPEVTRYTGPGHATVGEYRDKICNEFLARYGARPSLGLFAAIAKVSNEFIGWFLLRPAGLPLRGPGRVTRDRHRDRLPAQRRRGVEGTRPRRRELSAAFRDPNVTAIVASALVPNRDARDGEDRPGASANSSSGLRRPSVMYALCRARLRAAMSEGKCKPALVPGPWFSRDPTRSRPYITPSGTRSRFRSHRR